MHPLSRFAPSPSRGTTPVAWQSQFHGVRWHGLLRGPLKGTSGVLARCGDTPEF